MKAFQKITETSSPYRNLEKLGIKDLLALINQQDHLVPDAVQKVIPQIEELVRIIVDRMLAGGRLFYLGAGTSGRLGILDASECPPTFGVPHGLVVGLIAGGDEAIRKAVEFAEDDLDQGWKDLEVWNISQKDVVLGIAASGTTPYVVGALRKCREMGITTGALTCNPGAPICSHADLAIEVEVGPEFITGSTRMKSGTAQKLVLNMISTTVMIQLGRVEDNKMVNMQLSNDKLVDRGVRMIMENLHEPDYEKAKSLLLAHGSVKKAIHSIKNTLE
ncbi:MAG: N-acetylmuramic acid 6-phosphate etherase [Chitinophagaceae bacterium]